MDKAIADLQQYIEREPDTAQRIHATKLLDQIRAQS
jgi:hypothetical protein